MGRRANVAWSVPGALQLAIDDAVPQWWYNYHFTADGIINPVGTSFLPMFFSTAQVTDSNIITACNEAGQNGWILFLNEPDLDGQTVANAITAWNTLTTHPMVIARNIQFVGPAPTDVIGPGGTSQWLADWIAGISNPPLVLGRHAYTSTAGIFTALSLYGRYYQMNPYWLAPYRFWLTEFGPGVDGGVASNQAFMQTIYDFLVGHTFRVDRLAWYFGGPKDINASAYPWRAEYNNDGTPTALGTYWNALAITP